MGESFGKISATQLVNTFVKFLNDEVTAANIQDTLQILLRTEGKVVFDPAQIAKISNHWAVQRYEKAGIPVYQSLCNALLRIYQAETFCSLPYFKMNDFIKPFVNELFRLCPAEERDIFKTELPNVKKIFLQSLETESKKTMPEYEVQFRVDDSREVTEGEWIQITGERFQEVLTDLKAIVDDTSMDPARRLQALRPLVPKVRETFVNIIHDQVLKDRLAELINLGQTMVNRREIEPANELLSFVAEVVDNRKDQFLEQAVSSILKLEAFDSQLLDDYLADPIRKKSLKPLLSNIFETRPDNLLSSLVQEENADKRKRLLAFITVYEPEIFRKVLNEVNRQSLSKWYYKRNLLFLLTKISRPEDITVATVQDCVLTHIHPESHPTLMQEAVQTYLYFNCERGIELILQLLKSPHVADVIHLDKFYEPAVLEEFKSVVAQGAASFDFSPYPRAIQMILGAVREELSNLRMKMGKLLVGVNQKLVVALLQMLSNSSSPAVENALRELAADSRMALVQHAVQQTLANMHQSKKAFL
jgi:hypothetical protein